METVVTKQKLDVKLDSDFAFLPNGPERHFVVCINNEGKIGYSKQELVALKDYLNSVDLETL